MKTLKLSPDKTTDDRWRVTEDYQAAIVHTWGLPVLYLSSREVGDIIARALREGWNIIVESKEHASNEG